MIYIVIDNKIKNDLIISQNQEIRVKSNLIYNLSKEVQGLKNQSENAEINLGVINKDVKRLNEELNLYETKILPLDYLLENYLNITVGTIYAWQDFMPCAEIPGQSNCRYNKHIVFDLELENNIGFDLDGLYIPRANILKEGKVVGNFVPSFQSVRLCSGNETESEVDSINLSNGCKLKFQARTWFWDKNRSYEDLPDFVGNIKVQFRFINGEYYTDIYETNETIIGYTS